MKIFITDEQKAELEHLHHTCRDKRECDRIKAVLLASEGWSSVMIAQALRLHEMTVNRHISDYLNQGKLKSDNGGSDSLLSQEQTDFLINHLSQHLFHHT
ncbi:helix-turn-helix domain-containing protein, partial [Photorhabdus laumondii]